MWTMDRPPWYRVAVGRARMNRNGRTKKLTRRRSEWQHASGYVVTERSSREAVASPNLAFTGLDLVPVAVIAHENLVRLAVDVNSVRISKSRGRSLDEPHGFL